MFDLPKIRITVRSHVPSAGVEKIPFEIESQGCKLRGFILRPRRAGRLPAAIVSHGFGSCTRDTKKYARVFADEGYAAVCFDFCMSGSGKSSGSSLGMSVLTEKTDLLNVLDYVKGLDFVDPDHIILTGCSQGGLVSALAAAAREDDVERLVLYYPALCIPDDARRGQMINAKFDPGHVPQEFRALFVRLDGQATAAGMLRNWTVVYLGNAAGALLVAAGCAFGGQLQPVDRLLLVLGNVPAQQVRFAQRKLYPNQLNINKLKESQRMGVKGQKPHHGQQLGLSIKLFQRGQGAQLHRALLQVGGGLLQGLDHGLRGTGRLSQQGGGLAAGLAGVEGDELDLMKHLFYCLHKNFSFALLVFWINSLTIWVGNNAISLKRRIGAWSYAVADGKTLYPG